MATSTDAGRPGAKPVNVFRDRAISVSVFRNQATVRDKERTFFSASLQRSYKAGDAFKSTHSLDKDDLPVAQLLGQAWAWIVQEEAAMRQKASA